MGRAITYNGHAGKHYGNYIRGALITLLALGAAGGIYKSIETHEPKKHEIRMKNSNEFRDVAVEKNARIENIKNDYTSSNTSGALPKPPEKETFGGFTKKNFADLLEPEYRVSVPNVHITPEDVKRVKKLTPEQMAYLYRIGPVISHLEDISTSEAVKRFLKLNDYKGPGWLVWVMIDEDPSAGLMPASVFVNNEGRLVVHSTSNVDF